MILDFLIPGMLQIDMSLYVKSMIEEFHDKLSYKTMMPWNENLFKVDPTLKCLKNEQAKVFRMFVMKGMFLCKHGCQPGYPTSCWCIYGNKSCLATEPNEGDWKKLVKMMNYLKVVVWPPLTPKIACI
jgi:hypothetical protein